MYSEIRHYLGMIEDLRLQVRTLVQDLPAEALNWRPLPTSEDHACNSLAVLAAHVAGAEAFWIAEVVGAMPIVRDREAEFRTKVETSDPLLTRLDRVAADTRRVFAELSLAALDETREVQDRRVSVRWAILHVIDHTALHLGHMQITYQLWRGGIAGPSPRWFERVPT